MRNRPILYLILGIIILIVPTLIYLCFLVPQMCEEYNILMASGGIIGGSGMYGVYKIPEKAKYSGLLKLVCTSFTLSTVIILVEKFIPQIVFLFLTFIISFIAFRVLLAKYRIARRKKDNAELAEEVARNVTKNTK